MDFVTIDLSGTNNTAVSFEPIDPYAGSWVTIDDVGIRAIYNNNGDTINFNTNIDSDGVITTNLTVSKWIYEHRSNGFIVGNWKHLSFSDLTYQIKSTEPVPEPATILLFGTGLAGLAGISIRRKKK